MSNRSDDFQEDDDLEKTSAGAADFARPSDWNIGQPLGFDENPRDQSEEMSFDFGGFEPSPSSYSLDDLEGDPNPVPGKFDGPEADSHSPSGEEDPGASVSEDIADGIRRRRLKILLVSALACVGMISAIAVPVYKTMKRPPPPKLLGQKTIRQPIAVPEFQEEFEFLVLATSEKDTNVVSVRLDFLFSASNAFEAFIAKETLYRETVYQYLLRARPSRNSQRLWQGILEKQLKEHMKENFPSAGLKAIRVAHWERL
jgi:hypothetical protein